LAPLFAVAAFAATLAPILVQPALVPPSFADEAPAPSLPPASATAPTPAPQPSPADRPGFLHQLGTWWGRSTATVDETFKGMRGGADDLKTKSSDAAKGAADSAIEATKGATATATDAVKGAASAASSAVNDALEATKNAASSIAKLPNTRVVDLRAACAKAPNGSSDCTDAAANGCRAKGFAGGKPLEIRSDEKCDIAGLSVGQLGRGNCTTEAVVVRAVCQ
jgi:hypothetical protein